MEDLKKKLHSHIFDGADGGGAEGASESGGYDYSEYTDDGQSEPEVVYGKAADSSEESHVGDDTDGQGGEEGNPDEEFEALIKGKFKPQYDARVHGAIENRFKNYNDNQSTLDGYADATALLFAKYGLDPGDVQGLKKAIENDDGIFSAAAEEEGVTADRYRENLRLRTEAARGRSMMEEMKAQREREATFRRWDNEAVELQEAFPSFNLNQELQNPDFVDALERIGNVHDAFMVSHFQDIMSGATAQASEASQKKTVENFKARAQRPPENGMRTQPAVVRKTDPSKFTDADIDEVIKRVQAGEQIIL